MINKVNYNLKVYNNMMLHCITFYIKKINNRLNIIDK